MKALILAHGTRGDVQPYVALAHGLRRAGHEPLLAAPQAMATLAEAHNAPFAPLDDGPNTLMDDPALRRAIETNYRGLRGKLAAFEVLRRTRPAVRRVFDDIAAVPIDGVDVVVHPTNLPFHHLAEKLGVPAVPVGLQPGWVPTSCFPNPMLPFRVPKALNHVSYRWTALAMRTLNGLATHWREDTLGLPRRAHQHDVLRTPDGRPTTVLQAFSEQVLPTVAAFPSSVHTTGYWFLPAAFDWSPPEHLRQFLDAGDPPVYVGFGSMANTDPTRTGRVVTEAVRLADVRAVVVAGWGGIAAEESTDRVLVLDQAPHVWLFPRMAAIVHHGGGGTTGAALASGRPQVICPFVAGQPFWARRMQESGVAPDPQPQRRLTAEGLAKAIRRAAGDTEIGTRAGELGATIRAEHGVENAVNVLEQLLTWHGSHA